MTEKPCSVRERISQPYVLAGLAVGVGLCIAGFGVASGIKSLQEANRVVTVRGLNEREVKADLGVWPITLKVADNNVVAGQAALEAQKKIVLAFLTEHGIAGNEISIIGQRVIDKLANEYGNNPDGFRYILQATVQVRTANVQALEKASGDAGNLLKDGVTLASDGCSGGPDYSFTKLNDIKPQMLAQATANAREAAQQFANDSGSAIGGIRRASQGYFSITARDTVEENSSGGGYSCMPSSIDKRVRVVTTIDYSLD